MERVLMNINDPSIQDQLAGADTSGFLFGGKNLLYRPEGAKPLNKTRAAFEQLKGIGLLPEDVSFTNEGLLHDKDGNPSFVGMNTKLGKFYAGVRVFQNTGETVSGRTQYDPNLVDVENADIITGVCLFGAATALGTTDTGEVIPLAHPSARSYDENTGKVVTFDIDRKLHPYEAETIGRVTRYMHILQAPAHRPARTVYMHVPRLEYRLYGLDLKDKGVLDQEASLVWGQAVDQRAQGMHALLARRIPGGAQYAKVVAPLVAAREYIEAPIKHSADDLAAILAKDDKLWASLLQANPPRSFSAINYQSYVYAYLKAAEGRTVVAIENPEEQAILVQTIKAGDKINRGTIIAMYPHPQLITEGQAKLFFYPNHNGKTNKALTQIAREG